MDNIEKRLKEIVSRQLGVPIDNIKNHSRFIDDLGGDSLDTVEMVLTVEDEFGIEIDDETAEQMYDIECVLKYLNSKI